MRSSAESPSETGIIRPIVLIETAGEPELYLNMGVVLRWIQEREAECDTEATRLADSAPQHWDGSEARIRYSGDIGKIAGSREVLRRMTQDLTSGLIPDVTQLKVDEVIVGVSDAIQ